MIAEPAVRRHIKSYEFGLRKHDIIDFYFKQDFTLFFTFLKNLRNSIFAVYILALKEDYMSGKAEI